MNLAQAAAAVLHSALLLLTLPLVTHSQLVAKDKVVVGDRLEAMVWKGDDELAPVSVLHLRLRSQMCKSEPQSAERWFLTTTSVCSVIRGIGRSSTATWDGVGGQE